MATVAAISAVAYAAADMAHEALGHGVCALFSNDVRIVSLTSVALQTAGSSRMVAAAGTIANVVFGLLALWWFRASRRFDSGRYFLWIFAAVNLLTGTGYLFYSAVTNFGDWAVVIAGRTPPLLWRATMGVAGLVMYVIVINVASSTLTARVRAGKIGRDDIRRLVWPAYLSGSVLLLASSALNPIGLRLIFLVGIAGGFAATAGLVWIPGLVEENNSKSESVGSPLPFSRGWIIAGVVVAIVFIGVLGPGVRF